MVTTCDLACYSNTILFFRFVNVEKLLSPTLLKSWQQWEHFHPKKFLFSLKTSNESDFIIKWFSLEDQADFLHYLHPVPFWFCFFSLLLNLLTKILTCTMYFEGLDSAAILMILHTFFDQQLHWLHMWRSNTGQGCTVFQMLVWA